MNQKDLIQNLKQLENTVLKIREKFGELHIFLQESVKLQESYLLFLRTILEEFLKEMP